MSSPFRRSKTNNDNKNMKGTREIPEMKEEKRRIQSASSIGSGRFSTIGRPPTNGTREMPHNRQRGHSWPRFVFDFGCLYFYIAFRRVLRVARSSRCRFDSKLDFDQHRRNPVKGAERRHWRPGRPIRAARCGPVMDTQHRDRPATKAPNQSIKRR